jgi:dolichol-phosphate hexosyltransferase
MDPRMTNQISSLYSIVIPARDEEETIGEVLRGVRDMTDDLVVVDGHSTDRTIAIAREYSARVVQDNGRGKGDAVRVGLETARHPITVFIDADGSHDPKDIVKLVQPIAAGDADLVMGSRMLGGSEELFGDIAEVVRLLGSLVISLSINYRYGVRLTDYQNGFRAIRTEVGKTIGLTSNITTIEQEMAMKCLQYGYRVIERPTHEFRRRGGVSKINVLRAAHVYVWNLISGLLRPRRSGMRALSTAEHSGQAGTDKPVSATSFSADSLGFACPSCDWVGETMLLKERSDLQLCRCRNCGLVHQSKLLRALDITSLYGDDYYDSWGLDDNQDELWKIKVRTYCAYLDLLPRYMAEALSSPRLLDIGCAHGFMLEAARQRGLQASGVEISPAASVARQRGFVVYDRPLEDLNIPDGTFDAITAIDVLEHIPDVKGFMAELYRILKPDGVLLIVTPDVGTWVAKIMRNTWPHYKTEHLFYFTKHSLSLFLRRKGFRVRRIKVGFKYVTFDYVVGHFRKHTPGPLTSLLTFLYPRLPLIVRRTPLCLPTEMLAIAQRERSPKPMKIPSTDHLRQLDSERLGSVQL